MVVLCFTAALSAATLHLSLVSATAADMCMGAGAEASANKTRHDHALLHATDNARGAVHGAHPALRQHCLPLPYSLLHSNAQGKCHTLHACEENNVQPGLLL